MSPFFTRINTAIGTNPLHPFEIPPAVVAKLGFVHRVIRQSKLFDAVVTLNFKGPFRLSTLVAERMVADAAGRSSTSARAALDGPARRCCRTLVNKAWDIDATTKGAQKAAAPSEWMAAFRRHVTV